MSEVKAIPILELHRKIERRIERAIKACRINPMLIDQVRGIIEQLRVLKVLSDTGVSYISYDIPLNAVYIQPPFPRELMEFYRKMRVEDVQTGGAYKLGEKAYVRISSLRGEPYAIINVSEPIDPLGEPDMDYNGLKMYSVERFKQYVEWCKKYVREVLSEIYGFNPENRISEFEKVMPRGDELGYIWIPCQTKTYYYYHEHNRYDIIGDEGLRSMGLKVVRTLYLTYSEWVTHKRDGDGCRMLVAVIKPEKAEEVESRRVREMEEDNLRNSRLKEIIEEGNVKEAIEGGILSGDVVKISFEKLLRIIDVQGDVKPDVIEKVGKIHDYCDLYLINSSYIRAIGQSIHHPLRMLYLSRIARENGLDGEVVEKCRGYGKGRRYVMLVRDLCFYHGFWSLVAKPSKNLKVKYPCDARIEDGFLVIVDRERLHEGEA
ncbi:MAG: hypothetical protein LZ174_10615 [Thaumarchaeota archaeon]|nr:hypothetical protein [Candidatus Geocrenenecus arthurdayi]